MKQEMDLYRRRQGYKAHIKRRGSSFRANNRHRRLAEMNKYYIGYYLTEGGYVKRLNRGKRSKLLKHYADKKVRKTPCAGRSGYRKVYDYWWELD